MTDPATRSRSTRAATGWTLAAVLTALYAAALLWLHQGVAPYDAARMQRHLDEIGARIPGPIEPLPLPHASDHAPLAMARDPFAPIPAAR